MGTLEYSLVYRGEKGRVVYARLTEPVLARYLLGALEQEVSRVRAEELAHQILAALKRDLKK